MNNITTVVAYRDKNITYILSDGKVSSQECSVQSNAPKFIKINGKDDFYIGLSGKLDVLNLINHKIEDIQRDAIFEKGYLEFEFLPKLNKILKDYSIDITSCNYIFVGVSEIYYNSSGLNIIETTGNFFGTGSGVDLILGALEVLNVNDELSTKEKLIKAICIAEKYDLWTGKPYYLLNVNNDILEVIQ